MLNSSTTRAPKGPSVLHCSASELNGGPCTRLRRFVECGGHQRPSASSLRELGKIQPKCADRQELSRRQERGFPRWKARPSLINHHRKAAGSSSSGQKSRRKLSNAVAELRQSSVPADDESPMPSLDSPSAQQSLFSHLWKAASVQPRDNVPHLFQQADFTAPLDQLGSSAEAPLRGLFLSKNSYEGKQVAGSVLISVPLSHALMVPVSSPKSGRAAQGKPAVAELACRLLEVLQLERPTGALEGQELSSMEQEVSMNDEEGHEAAVGATYGPEAVPWRTQELWRQLEPLLPQTFHSIADWSDEELEALQFASDIGEVKASREGQQVLVDLVREASGEDEARARWAVRLVLSRSFTLSAPASTQSISGGDQSQRWFQALIPFIDMANHAPDSIPVKQSSSHPVNDRSAGISAFTPIPRPVRATASWRVAQGPPDLGRRLPKPDAIGAWHMQLVASSGVLGSGDEITISYGPHTSLSFLLNFGFLPDYNPGAKALIYSSLQDLMDDVDQRVKFASRKEDALRSLVPEESLFWAGEGGSAHRLFAILCILHASSREELAQLENTMREQRSLSNVYIEPATRALAARQISTRCADILSSVATSPEADTELLYSSLVQKDSTSPLSIALKHRMHQKAILRECEDRYKMMWDKRGP